MSTTSNFSPVTGQLTIFGDSANNGVVISRVPRQALAVTLTPQTPIAKNVAFNDLTNTFYLET